MITNAQNGMRVRFINQNHFKHYNQTGTIITPNIVESYYRPNTVSMVRFDRRIYGTTDHACFHDYLDPEILSPEQEAIRKQEEEKRLDQQRRLEHAMKYL